MSLLMLALAAAAQSPADAPPPAAGTPAVEEKKICRRVQTTGSRFAKRECRSAAEWRTIDGQAGGGFNGLSGSGVQR